jgi:hypothetical protein
LGKSLTEFSKHFLFLTGRTRSRPIFLTPGPQPTRSISPIPLCHSPAPAATTVGVIHAHVATTATGRAHHGRLPSHAAPSPPIGPATVLSPLRLPPRCLGEALVDKLLATLAAGCRCHLSCMRSLSTEPFLRVRIDHLRRCHLVRTLRRVATSAQNLATSSLGHLHKDKQLSATSEPRYHC